MLTSHVAKPQASLSKENIKPKKAYHFIYIYSLVNLWSSLLTLPNFSLLFLSHTLYIERTSGRDSPCLGLGPRPQRRALLHRWRLRSKPTLCLSFSSSPLCFTSSSSFLSPFLSLITMVTHFSFAFTFFFLVIEIWFLLLNCFGFLNWSFGN